MVGRIQMKLGTYAYYTSKKKMHADYKKEDRIKRKGDKIGMVFVESLRC